MIQNSLSYKTKRILKIAERLVNNEETLHISEIQEFNDCSLKTAYDDIYFLMSLENNILNVEFANKRCKSKTNSTGNLILLKTKLYQEEALLNLLLNIYFYPEKTLVDHSLDLNYSESYTRVQISALNKQLEALGFKVVFNRDTYSYHISVDKRESLIFLIAELIEMTELTHYLPQLSNDDLSMIELVKNEYSKDIPQSIIDQLIILFRIIKHDNKIYPDIPIIYSSQEIFGGKLEKLKKSVNRKLNDLMEDMDITLSEESINRLNDYLIFISMKAYYLPVKVDSFIHRYDYFYKQFSIENPYETKLFEKGLKLFSKKVEIDYLPYKEEVLFALYNNMLELRSYKTCKIAVYSDLGKSHEHALCQACKKHFPMHEFEPFNLMNDYKFIVSTVGNMQVDNGIEIVTVSDFISAQDVHFIYEAIYSKQ